MCPKKNEIGETDVVLNIMHDISNYVKNAEAVESLNKKLQIKNAELEQKNEEITSFAFVASHDMKKPLRKIHTFYDLLMQQEVENLSTKGKAIVEKKMEPYEECKILIDDILVLTKIHSDAHRQEDVDLGQVLSSVFEDMTEEISEFGSTINTKNLPVIKANSNHVFYLFKNLIGNAIKFQKSGAIPVITIISEIIDGGEIISRERGREYLKLSIADNGLGFDHRYAGKIFQVFSTFAWPGRI